jgi:hypothetical protein
MDGALTVTDRWSRSQRRRRQPIWVDAPYTAAAVRSLQAEKQKKEQEKRGKATCAGKGHKDQSECHCDAVRGNTSSMGLKG